MSMGELLSFADDKDRMLMIAGTLGAAAAGMAQPLHIVLIGDVLNGMNPSDSSSSITGKVDDAVLNYVYVAVVAMVAGFLQVVHDSVAPSEANPRRLHELDSGEGDRLVRRERAHAVVHADCGGGSEA